MTDWAETYRTLSDGQLEKLAGEDGFTEEASRALAQELAHRRLTPERQLKNKRQAEQIGLRDEARERTFPLLRIGLYFCGRRYRSEADRAANIQVRTKWVTLGYIPLVPVASYRFKCSEERADFLGSSREQRVVDRIGVDWHQVALTYLKTLTVMAAIIAGFALFVIYNRHK